MTPTITLPPTLPDKEQAQDQALFDANVDAYMDWLEINAPELNAFIDWVVLSRDDVIAAALAGDLPDLTGQALRILRVASSETGLEFAEAVVIPEYPGEAGKLLAVNGAETGVEYIAPEFPGNQVLLDTFDITGQTQWESPTLTADYIGYRIKIVNAEIASAGTVALLGFSTNDGTSYDTGNFSTTTYIDTGSGGPGNITTGQLWSGENLSGADFNLDVEIMRPDEAAFTTGRFDGWSSTASGHDVQKGHFTHRVASSINKIRLSDLAVATRGTLYLFGIKA